MKRLLFIGAVAAVVALSVWYIFFRVTGDGANNYTAYGEECQRTQILCIEGYERFDDAVGCGCRPVQ